MGEIGDARVETLPRQAETRLPPIDDDGAGFDGKQTAERPHQFLRPFAEQTDEADDLATADRQVDRSAAGKGKPAERDGGGVVLAAAVELGDIGAGDDARHGVGRKLCRLAAGGDLAVTQDRVFRTKLPHLVIVVRDVDEGCASFGEAFYPFEKMQPFRRGQARRRLVEDDQRG
ncbi:MAG: hypothetical protein E5V88_30195, partial [Mesorhizobium sp.]